MPPCPQCSANNLFSMWPVLLAACVLLVVWQQWPRLGLLARAGAIIVGLGAVGVMVAIGGADRPRDRMASAGTPAPASVTRPAEPSPTPEAATSRDDAIPVAPEPVVAFYFHRTVRCHGCLQAEEWARRVVEDAFAAELSAGLITWSPVNIEQPADAHFVADFGLTGPSLVLARMSEAGPAEYLKLDAVWEFLDDYGRFAEYVAGEVASFMAASPPTPSH